MAIAFVKAEREATSATTSAGIQTTGCDCYGSGEEILGVMAAGSPSGCKLRSDQLGVTWRTVYDDESPQNRNTDNVSRGFLM